MYSMFASVSENVLPHILTFQFSSELLTFSRNPSPKFQIVLFYCDVAFIFKPQTQEMNKNTISAAKISSILSGANFFSFQFTQAYIYLC